MAATLGRYCKQGLEKRECQNRCDKRALVEGNARTSFVSISLLFVLPGLGIFLPPC